MCTVENMSENAITTSPSGTFQGIALENGQTAYKGIQFARASRWQHPTDVETYDSPVDATSNGSISPQIPGFLEQMLGTDPSSMAEDCLNLNVYCPQGVTDTSNLPVLFWIHGGAYTNGAGSIAWYDGSRLASRGVVVVAINYRLGALGFAGDGAVLGARLAARADVHDLDLKPQRALFGFDGDDRAQAALLRDLVNAGVEVVSFGHATSDLQERYLATVGQRETPP